MDEQCSYFKSIRNQSKTKENENKNTLPTGKRRYRAKDGEKLDLTTCYL